MKFTRELRRAGAIAWKDLVTERRTKANFNAIVFLAVLMLLMFGFALGPDTAALRAAAGGLIWLAVLFAGILAFNRSYELELQSDALEVLLMYPGDRWPIFVGKLIANYVFVLAVVVVVLPLAAVLYHVPLGTALGGVVLVTMLGSVGFVTLGTLYGALASRSRAREVLLPLLLFPMLVPVLIAATKATTALLGGLPFSESGAWLRMLLAFDAVFVTASLLVFDDVIGV